MTDWARIAAPMHIGDRHATRRSRQHAIQVMTRCDAIMKSRRSPLSFDLSETQCVPIGAMIHQARVDDDNNITHTATQGRISHFSRTTRKTILSPLSRPTFPSRTYQPLASAEAMTPMPMPAASMRASCHTRSAFSATSRAKDAISAMSSSSHIHLHGKSRCTCFTTRRRDAITTNVHGQQARDGLL